MRDSGPGEAEDAASPRKRDVGGRPVLVTGGAGYIGGHVVLALLDRGFVPVVLDRLAAGRGGAFDARVAVAQGGVDDERLIRRILRTQRIECVMHFAGSASIAESALDPLSCYRNNTARTLSLVESALAEGVRHFVFASTAAVYGRGGKARLSEAAAVAPASPYARSKLMAERILTDVAAAHPINVAALRCFNVVGVDPAGRWSRAEGAAPNLLRLALDAAQGRRGPLVIEGADDPDRDETSIRDYVHVSDVATAHVLALEALIADPLTSLTLNCGAGRGYSVLQVVDEIARQVGRPVPFVGRPRPPGSVDRLVADNRRLREMIGWRPRLTGLPRLLADTLRWGASRNGDPRGSQASD